MEKYYTPNSEDDFSVGLECQTYLITTIGGCGENKSITHNWFDYTWRPDLHYIRLEDYRIKFLDREDIEEVLGVKQLKGDDVELNFQILLDDSEDFYEFDYDTETLELTIELYKEMENDRFACYTIFSGEIKNKTEFKKLIKQLRIWNR